MNQVKIGELVACQWEKESWYRAKITEIVRAETAEKVGVCYVDYGNSQYVDLNRLSKLEPKFTQLPIQCIMVELDGLIPIVSIIVVIIF